MRIAQINVVASLSTGRIAVSLCRTAMQAGHRALICHSRDHAPGRRAQLCRRQQGGNAAGTWP